MATGLIVNGLRTLERTQAASMPAPRTQGKKRLVISFTRGHDSLYMNV